MLPYFEQLVWRIGPIAGISATPALTPAQWVAAVVMAALPFVALRRRTLAFAITGVVILGAGWACVGGSR